MLIWFPFWISRQTNLKGKQFDILKEYLKSSRYYLKTSCQFPFMINYDRIRFYCCKCIYGMYLVIIWSLHILFNQWKKDNDNLWSEWSLRELLFVLFYGNYPFVLYRKNYHDFIIYWTLVSLDSCTCIFHLVTRSVEM